MRRAVASVVALSLSACASAPLRAPEGVSAPVADKAVGCTPESPCGPYSDGVWLPMPLAAQTAEWGAGYAGCQEKLKKCGSTGLDTAGFWIALVAGAIAGGSTVAAGYELRDWIRK